MENEVGASLIKANYSFHPPRNKNNCLEQKKTTTATNFPDFLQKIKSYQSWVDRFISIKKYFWIDY